jgi:hypothetical protein
MITIVAGFGRCGSSLAMQMLEVGGIQCTGVYPAFEGPEGAALLVNRLTLPMMTAVDGCAVKLLDPHRGSIPTGPDYRAILMERNHREEGLSQAKFLSEMTGMHMSLRDARQFAASYAKDTPAVLRALKAACGDRILRVRFETMLSHATLAATHIASFAGIDPARVPTMASVVRARPPECAPDLSLELELIRSRDRAPSYDVQPQPWA